MENRFSAGMTVIFSTHGEQMKIVYINVSAMVNPWIEAAAQACTDKGFAIDVVQLSSETLDSEENVFNEQINAVASSETLRCPPSG
jgi:hypothetical protein